MYCRQCGKEINDNAYICPFCGCKTHDEEKTQNVVVQTVVKQSNGAAIAGFILALLGIWPLNLIFSIIGSTRAGKQGGTAFAVIGIILSVLETIAVVFYIILVLVVIDANIDSAALCSLIFR